MTDTIRPLARELATALTDEELEKVAGGASGSFTKVHRSIDVDYEDTDDENGNPTLFVSEI